MPYYPPDYSSLCEDIKNLEKVYQGNDNNRLKLRNLLLASANLFFESKYLIAILIFAAEKIYGEYNYLSPQKNSYLFGYGPGSSLYTAIQNALHITEKNPLSDETRIIYLAKLIKYLLGESQLILDGTEYTCRTSLQRDIEKIIQQILLRSHPEMTTAVTTSSYLSYIPAAPANFLQGIFSKTEPEKPELTPDYREALLSLSESVISQAKKNELRLLTASNVFEDRRLG